MAAPHVAAGAILTTLAALGASDWEVVQFGAPPGQRREGAGCLDVSPAIGGGKGCCYSLAGMWAGGLLCQDEWLQCAR